MSETTYEVVRVAVSATGALVAMSWVALMLWTFRDSQRRSTGRFTPLISTALVAAGFLFGWIIYMLLRPQSTVADRYRNRLNERRLALASTDGDLCPHCSTRLQPDYRVCPHCGLEVKRPCNICKRPVRPVWNVCPYCGNARDHVRPRPIEAAQTLRVPDARRVGEEV
ncbi:MAG: zinc ribbon domain-containing protein [Chloroflexia bacterium]